jgi:hypothetical protein
MASGMARATGVDRRWSARVRGGSAADVAAFRSGDDGAAAGGEVREVLQFEWGKEEFLNRGLEKKGKGRDLLPTVAVAMASPRDSYAEDPLMDGNGEPTVSKGEVTCNAALDERRSTGAARGRGGAQAASTWKHRGERVQRCSSLSGKKGEKGVGRSGTVCARARGGGGRQRTETTGVGGGRVSRGGALGVPVWWHVGHT